VEPNSSRVKTKQYGRHLPQEFLLKKLTLLFAITILLSMAALAQDPSPTNVTVDTLSGTPTFRVTVVSRTARAVNYQHRSGASKLEFAGTSLMPSANGQAKVESKKGYIEIEVEFGNLQKPTTFGNEYLTYILWAISPEGRAVNLGEVLVGSNNRSKLDVTTDLQAFALVVTAEPYYAVRQPSNVVVLENVIRDDTKGTSTAINAKYDLLERGGYIPTGYKFDPVVLNANLPLEFFEARNALRIAQSEGADKYATDSYGRAVQMMNKADAFATQKDAPKKELIAVAREAVQTAEDSRAIAVTKIEEERQAKELQSAADAQERSRAQARNAMRQTREAESAKAQAEAQASAARADSEKAKLAMADSEAASAAALAAAKADSDRSKLAMADSEAASAAALAAARADADQSRQSAQQAESEKAAMRSRLSEQLNTILKTRDSARGLIVSMSDVLFDTGKHQLKPGAREKLAKVAGILLAYPGLNIEVDGFTDSVGSDSSNQTLSENRASSVRDYLVQQGVLTGAINSKGFGNSQAVATNDNAAGRQMNRRVELVVSGEAIGNQTTTTTGELR
jgi:outer membrane protein OmpA-like peptidoglycan-associated protein